MATKLLSWLKKKRKLLIVVGIILSLIGIILGYWLKWDWTGFPEHVGPNTLQYQATKTLWDWLQLTGILAIPIVVGLGTLWFTTKQSQESDAENKDNQRETALQVYIDKISELLLKENLRKSGQHDEVQIIARVRTLTVLPRLDDTRKRSVLQFLYESKLINKDKPVINLSGADFSKASLRGTNLTKANLQKAQFAEADLTRADLSFTSLIEANLLGANLTGADLTGADLTKANLVATNLSRADLTGADLSEAVLPRSNLTHTNLSKAISIGANLSKANLTKANLTGTDLSGAMLLEADLTGAELTGANLSLANLSKAKIIKEQWNTAKILAGATMPDGHRYNSKLSQDSQLPAKP